MLCLSRKKGEEIIIEFEGKLVKILVWDVGPKKVRLAFDAPPEVKIDRTEIYESKKQGLKTKCSLSAQNALSTNKEEHSSNSEENAPVKSSSLEKLQDHQKTV